MLNLTPGQVVDSWSHLNKVYSGTRRATPTEYGATENSTVPASPVMTPVSRISSTTEFGLETDGYHTVVAFCSPRYNPRPPSKRQFRQAR